MTGPTDPDDREEAWRLYETAHLTIAALGELDPMPGSFFEKKLRSYWAVKDRLEKRWGFRQHDVKLP